MPNLLSLSIACALAANAFAQTDDHRLNEQMAPDFTLQDQYEKSHAIAYPQAKPLVFSIGDQASAKDAPPWKEAILKKYGDRIRYVPLANLAALPSSLRAAVRIAMRTVEKDPVLCDWDGAVSKSYGARKNVANIILVSRKGIIRHRAYGKMTDSKRTTLFISLDKETKTESVSDKEKKKSGLRKEN